VGGRSDGCVTPLQLKTPASPVDFAPEVAELVGAGLGGIDEGTQFVGGVPVFSERLQSFMEGVGALGSVEGDGVGAGPHEGAFRFQGVFQLRQNGVRLDDSRFLVRILVLGRGRRMGDTMNRPRGGRARRRR